MFNVVSVRLVFSVDAQLQGQRVSYRHLVGACRDVQVVHLGHVEGDVWLNCDLLFGLLLWSQVSLCGLSLGYGQLQREIKFLTIFSSEFQKEISFCEAFYSKK